MKTIKPYFVNQLFGGKISGKRLAKTLLELAAFCLMFFGASAAQAQYCRGSEMLYIVRDEQGKIINPATLEAPAFLDEETMRIPYAEAEQKREGYWRAGEAVKESREQKLGGLDRETGILYAMHENSGGACNFTRPVSYRFSNKGKTMNLVFRFAKGQDLGGRIFLVDSLSFRQGTFEIDLPDKSGYYAPENWRKTSDAADAPAKIAVHHIRGRVVNAVTKQPVANAAVRLETAPPFYGEHSAARKNKSQIRTDADGRFAIENLRGDLLDDSIDVGIFIEHADYAAGSNVFLLHQRDEKKTTALISGKTAQFVSQDNLTVELQPLVTVSGRVVEAKTGGNLPDAANLPKNFIVTADYGGGYLGGNLNIPRGKGDTRPQSDGTFTFRTAPGENEIYAGGKLDGKSYYLVGIRTKINVPAEGLQDLVLKIERDKSELKKDFQALGKQGNDFYAAGRFEEALKVFKEAARIFPEETTAQRAIVITHSALGVEFQNSGRYEEAVAHLSEALKIDPTNERALQSRAPTFLALNRGAEASSDAEKFLAAHSWKHDQSIYLALFGTLGYLSEGKKTEAQKLLETASQNADKTRWAMPVVEYLLGKMSADDLLKLAADNDKMTEARAYIGMNLLLAGKLKTALPHLRWVVENGNKNFHEYHFAKAALKRAEKQ